MIHALTQYEMQNQSVTPQNTMQRCDWSKSCHVTST